MSEFDPHIIVEEVIMLGGMIDEIDRSIATAHESKEKLVAVRAALASTVDIELPADDKSQLKLSLVGEGEEVELSVDE